jgi:tRNA/rRNA methyltransferase
MSQPVIILIETQIAQNIGTTARAMANFGLTKLRLVRPFADPLSKEARALAAGADDVLEHAEIFDRVEDALADLHCAYATTARLRDMVGLHMTPRQAAETMHRHVLENTRFGVLFGPERAGLNNEDVALCTGIISVPVNPHFSSLNLAQTVLLVAYEFYQTTIETPKLHLKQGESDFATKGELMGLFEHLEKELDKAGYFRTAHKRPKMVRSIHTMFSRVLFTAQEVRTLRGIVADLSKPKGISSHKEALSSQSDKPDRKKGLPE